MEKNSLWMLIGALVVGAILGYMFRSPQPAPATPPTTVTSSPTPQAGKPSGGWDLHIDAIRHFPGKAEMVAHHYCKLVAGMWECQLFDSDKTDARLVGVEVVVETPTYNAFTQAEKANWHYHKDEIPKVEAKLPDLSAEEAAKVVATLEETYGKIYLLWDPSLGNLPIGNPSVNILK